MDCDGIRSSEDNCPFTYNPDQKDSDKNGIGDACDGANKGRIESHCDPDGDGIPSYKDNCPLVCNPKQEDKNKNGIGDVCDSALLSNWVRLNPCPKPVPNKNLSPSRAPAPTPPVIPEPQVNEAAILDPNGDFDCDGVPNRTDNCMWVYNPDQKDSNKDGIGDACIDPSKKDVRCDRDGDKVNELNDNCPYVCNPDQKDSNKNGIGDACEGKKGNSIKITPCPGRKTKHKLERGSFRKN